MSGFSSLMSSFAQAGADRADAAAYGAQATSLRTAASGVELQAAELANNIRKKYMSAASDALAIAAARGGDVSNIASRLERGGEAAGKDIETTARNASFKAGTLRAEAGIAKAKGKALAQTAGLSSIAGMLRGTSNIALGAGLIFGGE
jgi:hypothetical protein